MQSGTSLETLDDGGYSERDGHGKKKNVKLSRPRLAFATSTASDSPPEVWVFTCSEQETSDQPE